MTIPEARPMAARGALRGVLPEGCLLVVEGAQTGARNMALDEEYLLETQANPDASALLRLYAWQPFTASLGRHQREAEIDAAECAARGYDVVRRPTGGRAVLHAREITYSLILRHGAANPHEIYRQTHLWILRGLEILGAEGVEFGRHQPDFREHYRTIRSAACFASSARNELLWRGRKIVGSAQRISGAALLQHGSILLGDGHEDIADVVACPADERAALREFLRGSSATLEHITGKSVGFAQAADALTEAL